MKKVLSMLILIMVLIVSVPAQTEFYFDLPGQETSTEFVFGVQNFQYPIFTSFDENLNLDLNKYEGWLPLGTNEFNYSYDVFVISDYGNIIIDAPDYIIYLNHRDEFKPSEWDFFEEFEINLFEFW